MYNARVPMEAVYGAIVCREVCTRYGMVGRCGF